MTEYIGNKLRFDVKALHRDLVPVAGRFTTVITTGDIGDTSALPGGVTATHFGVGQYTIVVPTGYQLIAAMVDVRDSNGELSASYVIPSAIGFSIINGGGTPAELSEGSVDFVVWLKATSV